MRRRHRSRPADDVAEESVELDDTDALLAELEGMVQDPTQRHPLSESDDDDEEDDDEEDDFGGNGFGEAAFVTDEIIDEELFARRRKAAQIYPVDDVRLHTALYPC